MVRTLMAALVLSVALVGPVFGGQNPAGSQEARAAKPAPMLNLNTATPTELETLPGIGPKVATRIVDYRKAKGPFKKIEELMNVQGIGEKAFLKIRPLITVAGKPEAAGQQ